MTEPIVKVQGIKKTYISDKGDHIALAGVDFDVARGEVVSIVGPSGAGKTTVLRIIAGLLSPSAGRVEVAGQPVSGQPPEQVGLVFQDYGRSLLPWLSITGNVALPLRSKGVDRAGARTLALGALDAVGLAGRGKAHPRELSGGMQQRVAVARARANEPQLLLMDEPFASVDAQTRMDLEDLVLPPRDQFGITVVIVTHDVDEAVYLSDRVIVLTPPPSVVSRIVEVDLPKPRDQQRTKDDVRFARLRGEVLDLVRGREPEARAA